MKHFDLSICNIHLFMGNQFDVMRNGECLYKDRKIILCGYKIHSTREEIISVLKNSDPEKLPYYINMELKENVEDWRTTCSCDNDNDLRGRCEHVAATLIYILKNENLNEINSSNLHQALEANEVATLERDMAIVKVIQEPSICQRFGIGINAYLLQFEEYLKLRIDTREIDNMKPEVRAILEKAERNNVSMSLWRAFLNAAMRCMTLANPHPNNCMKKYVRILSEMIRIFTKHHYVCRFLDVLPPEIGEPLCNIIMFAYRLFEYSLSKALGYIFKKIIHYYNLLHEKILSNVGSIHLMPQM